MAIQEKRRVPLLRRSSVCRGRRSLLGLCRAVAHFGATGAPILSLVLGAAWAAVAFGQRPDLKPLLAKVDPAIVCIETDNGKGHGFVVNAAMGLVATNYHVIAGATTATVTFPADHDGKTYPVEGLLAKMPGKDLALIRIKAGDKKLPALKIAEKPAAKGQAVYAGVPLGLTGVLSSGTVAAVSSGKEVDALLKPPGNPDYCKVARLDPDGVWLRVEAPISPGRNGGPLVNADGELVGITTFRFDSGPGDNLHFAVSAIHLKKLMAAAGTTVQLLFPSPPPKPRPTLTIEPYVPNPAKGDLDKTLAAWNGHGEEMVVLSSLLANCQERLRDIRLVDPGAGYDTRKDEKGTWRCSTKRSLTSGSGAMQK